MALTFDLYQVEVRNRIAATSTFYGTIDGELYSQAIVDAIIANGNVLDPEVTANGDTGINLFTNGVTTRTRGAELMFDYASEFDSAQESTGASAATYNETEVTKVRATPAEFGTTQPLFDQVALVRLEDTAPKYLVNLGATLEWDRVSHRASTSWCTASRSEFENDGGDDQSARIDVLQDRDRRHADHQPRIPFQAMDKVTLTVGAHQRVRRDAGQAQCHASRACAVRRRRQQRGGAATRRSRRSASTALTTTASSTSASEVAMNRTSRAGIS